VTKNGDRKYRTAIGSAWPHGDREGFDSKFD
jgi:hypothetical protein